MAVVQDIGGGNTSGFVATRDQLNNDTYFDFNAVLVSSSQVDSAAELAPFDVVNVGNNGYSTSDAMNNLAFQSSFRSWVENTGGGVVMTGWGVYGVQDNARTDIDAIIPVNLQGGYSAFFATTTIGFTGSHPITAGLGSSLTVFSSTGANFVEFPTASPQLDDGATELGTISGNVVLAAAQKGAGRGVYLGPIYSAVIYNGSIGWGNSTLRSGAADQLLEQAEAWAGSASTNVVDVVDITPDPRNSAVDTVGAYSRSLSAAEIFDIYASGVAGQPRNLAHGFQLQRAGADGLLGSGVRHPTSRCRVTYSIECHDPKSLCQPSK